MTEVVLKNRINDMQMSILMHLLKSWNVEAEVLHIPTDTVSVDSMPFSVGMWADYDIDDRTLRAKAWGINQQPTQ